MRPEKKAKDLMMKEKNKQELLTDLEVSSSQEPIKLEQTIPTNPPHMYMKPKPGYVWNPLRSLPPNMPCPCLSRAKFKKCCRDKLVAIVSIKEAEEFKKKMLEPDLIFLKDDNQSAVLGALPKHIQEDIERKSREH